ncbi:MAG: glycine C-acetyltransferase [Candidatus Obscuribacter sp.]|nr:glycine C-acetyltransferase [Candidatus Obscuribacter sp.]MBL8081675.1 glycine C-acetyltransferase [Candidatus Obscuribacter sp.]
MGVKSLYQNLDSELNKSREAKTYKYEVPVEGLQGGVVQAAGRSQVMLASNNYLGLANHPRIVEAARKGLEKYGYGLASVRFICGTQNIHLELEERIARFLGVESAILHSSCFAANEAFFTALVSADLGETDYRDVIYSDQLNHASIIDGIRLSRIAVKTTDLRAYKHNDVEQLKSWLAEDQAKDYRLSVIVTDGVFSMEGEYANLADFVDIAKRNDALLFVDESHSTGVLGATGRGTPEHCGVHGKIDVISGTLGKALGGAAGGFIAGKKVLVDYLRQKSRPYTFSNSLPPAIVCAAIEAINMLEEDNSLVEKLHQNTDYFRKEVQRLGFTILPGVHPIVPVMVGEASIAQDMSNLLLDEGVYVRGLWYPVVPKGEARLRVQISAAHEVEDLDRALSAFQKVGKKLGVV